MYLIHIVSRVVVMGILAAYLKGLSIAILLVLAIPINYGLTRYTLLGLSPICGIKGKVYRENRKLKQITSIYQKAHFTF